MYLTVGNINFDVLVPRVFRKYGTCMAFWVRKFYQSLVGWGGGKFPILGLSPKLRLTGPTCHQLTHHTNHTHPIDSHRLLCGVLPTRPGLIQCALHNAHSAMNELVPVWAQAPMEKTFSPPLSTTRGKLVSMKFCQNSVLVWYWSVLICPVGLSCSFLVWILCSCQILNLNAKKLHKLTESSTFLHLCFSIVFIWNLNLYMKPLVKSQTLKKQQHY